MYILICKAEALFGTCRSFLSTESALSWRSAACSALSFANASSMTAMASAVSGSLFRGSLLAAPMTSWNSPPALHPQNTAVLEILSCQESISGQMTLRTHHTSHVLDPG